MTSCHANQICWNRDRSRLSKHSLPSTGVSGRVFFALVPPGFLSSPICSDPSVSLGGVCCFKCPDNFEAESRSHKSSCKAPSREAARCQRKKLREASKHGRRARADVGGRWHSGLGGSLLSCILVIWKFFLLCNRTNPHPYGTPLLAAQGCCCTVWILHKSQG